jgi:hypothetical protein
MRPSTSSASLDCKSDRQSPSAPTKGSSRDLPLLEFLACVVEDRQAIYVSTPITTGLRYLQWLARHAPGSADRDAAFEWEVITPNTAHGRELVRRIRDHFPRAAVIDPTAVSLPGWEQGEYHELWAQVIHRYARLVVCGDGWEYSNGCAYEFLTASCAYVEVVDERYEPITVRAGIERIKTAVVEYRAAGVDPGFLAGMLHALDKLRNGEAKP